MSQSKSRVLAAILELARDLPPSRLDALAAALESSSAPLNWRELTHHGVGQTTKERIAALGTLVAGMPEFDARAIAFGIRAAAHAVTAISLEHRVEIAWTGPGTEAVPLRRVDQVLYELVESAESEVLVVTYAAYKAERALDALRAATERGVRVALVIELARESGGKITFDGLDSVRMRVPKADVFYWALGRRRRTAAGDYGAMHVKCLIADRKVALVSSANLTDHALEMNMELGLLVRGGLPGRLAAHFDQLLVRRELATVPGA